MGTRTRNYVTGAINGMLADLAEQADARDGVINPVTAWFKTMLVGAGAGQDFRTGPSPREYGPTTVFDDANIGSTVPIEADTRTIGYFIVPTGNPTKIIIPYIPVSSIPNLVWGANTIVFGQRPDRQQWVAVPPQNSPWGNTQLQPAPEKWGYAGRIVNGIVAVSSNTSNLTTNATIGVVTAAQLGNIAGCDPTNPQSIVSNALPGSRTIMAAPISGDDSNGLVVRFGPNIAKDLVGTVGGESQMTPAAFEENAVQFPPYLTYPLGMVTSPLPAAQNPTAGMFFVSNGVTAKVDGLAAGLGTIPVIVGPALLPTVPYIVEVGVQVPCTATYQSTASIAYQGRLGGIPDTVPVVAANITATFVFLSVRKNSSGIREQYLVRATTSQSVYAPPLPANYPSNQMATLAAFSLNPLLGAAQTLAFPGQAPYPALPGMERFHTAPGLLQTVPVELECPTKDNDGNEIVGSFVGCLCQLSAPAPVITNGLGAFHFGSNTFGVNQATNIPTSTTNSLGRIIPTSTGAGAQASNTTYALTNGYQYTTTPPIGIRQDGSAFQGGWIPSWTIPSMAIVGGGGGTTPATNISANVSCVVATQIANFNIADCDGVTATSCLGNGAYMPIVGPTDNVAPSAAQVSTNAVYWPNPNPGLSDDPNPLTWTGYSGSFRNAAQISVTAPIAATSFIWTTPIGVNFVPVQFQAADSSFGYTGGGNLGFQPLNNPAVTSMPVCGLWGFGDANIKAVALAVWGQSMRIPNSGVPIGHTGIYVKSVRAAGNGGAGTAGSVTNYIDLVVSSMAGYRYTPGMPVAPMVIGTASPGGVLQGTVFYDSRSTVSVTRVRVKAAGGAEVISTQGTVVLAELLGAGQTLSVQMRGHQQALPRAGLIQYTNQQSLKGHVFDQVVADCARSALGTFFPYINTGTEFGQYQQQFMAQEQEHGTAFAVLQALRNMIDQVPIEQLHGSAASFGGIFNALRSGWQKGSKDMFDCLRDPNTGLIDCVSKIRTAPMVNAVGRELVGDSMWRTGVGKVRNYAQRLYEDDGGVGHAASRHRTEGQRVGHAGWWSNLQTAARIAGPIANAIGNSASAVGPGTYTEVQYPEYVGSASGRFTTRTGSACDCH